MPGRIGVTAGGTIRRSSFVVILMFIGEPGTIVLADTCGYHKQLKPESDERVKLVCHYVSGTPYVAPAIEISAPPTRPKYSSSSSCHGGDHSRVASSPCAISSRRR